MMNLPAKQVYPAIFGQGIYPPNRHLYRYTKVCVLFLIPFVLAAGCFVCGVIAR